MCNQYSLWEKGCKNVDVGVDIGGDNGHDDGRGGDISSAGDGDDDDDEGVG